MGQVSNSKYMVNAPHWHRPDRMKACIMCGEVRSLGDFYAYGYTTKQGKESIRYESRCKPCSRARRKEYYSENTEQCQVSSQGWKKRNADRIKQYNKRRQSEQEVRDLKAYHQRLRKARMRSGEDDDPAIREIYRKAKMIEAQVESCPVFDIPELGHEMQVDHIHPLSKGGAHVAANLQILPKGINMRKGVSWGK